MVLARAGSLPPPVREYIQTELDILVEIPALRIDDQGILMGGYLEEGKEDVLDCVRTKSSISPKIVVGPDSIGTLSFTSGSTGIPKGISTARHHITIWFVREQTLQMMK